MLINIFFLDSSDLNRTVNWKDSCRLHVPLYNSISLKTGPLDLNILQKVEKNSSTTEIQVRNIKSCYYVFKINKKVLKFTLN